MLMILGVLAGFEMRTGHAAEFTVQVRVVGLQPSVATRVYTNGTYRTTIYGDGSWSFQASFPTAVSVDRHVPDGYPYYGYPYYMYPGPLWGPYGQGGISFYCLSSSRSVTSATTLTFRYDPLFFLYVKSEKGSPQGTGWYMAGTWAYISISAHVEESSGTRYRFERWTGGQFRDDARTSATLVFMDGPKVVEAAWVMQHRLTVNSHYGEVAGAGWYDRGQAATFSVASSVDGGEGVRHVFSAWTGDFSGASPSGTVTMDSPKTVTATWKTQYRLTIDAGGGQVGETTRWVDAGNAISVSAVSPSAVVEGRSRLVFARWEGDSTATAVSVTVLMDGPKSLKAVWRQQYHLTVESRHGAATGEGWYDVGSVAEFTAPQEATMEPPLGYLGGKYVFAGWTGDITSDATSNTIVMDAAHSVSAQWTPDYTIPAVIIVALTSIVAVLAVVAFKKGIGNRVGFKLPTLNVGQKKAPSNHAKNARRTGSEGLPKARK